MIRQDQGRGKYKCNCSQVGTFGTESAVRKRGGSRNLPYLNAKPRQIPLLGTYTWTVTYALALPTLKTHSCNSCTAPISAAYPYTVDTSHPSPALRMHHMPPANSHTFYPAIFISRQTALLSHYIERSRVLQDFPCKTSCLCYCSRIRAQYRNLPWLRI